MARGGSTTTRGASFSRDWQVPVSSEALDGRGSSPRASEEVQHPVAVEDGYELGESAGNGGRRP
jgi:hypothetical protein